MVSLSYHSKMFPVSLSEAEVTDRLPLPHLHGLGRSEICLLACVTCINHHQIHRTPMLSSGFEVLLEVSAVVRAVFTVESLLCISVFFAGHLLLYNLWASKVLSPPPNFLDHSHKYSSRVLW